MILKIGNRSTHNVPTYGKASEIYCAARDASEEGASTFPVGIIRGSIGPLYVSYNGKIWRGRPQDWKVGDVPVYNPYGPVAA